jgi:hypothetical protein
VIHVYFVLMDFEGNIYRGSNAIRKIDLVGMETLWSLVLTHPENLVKRLRFFLISLYRQKNSYFTGKQVMKDLES